jgi:ATP-dependent Clp protease adapter protein ClpS
VAATTQNAEETRWTGAADPPWNVVLWNSWHPVSYVVWALVRSIPGLGVGRATRVMWTAHTQGRSVAKSCHRELAELYEERLRAKGLTATTEPAAPSSS